ncbi:MAG: hypothetical protein KFF73_10210 [Cyclobacteriaceae bacterium]|nr:hypothetical protein [Cyclobacteriaceae bacterium]
MKNEIAFFKTPSYTTSQLSLLVLLRVIIGWHIFYEGFSKLIHPNWSSVGYLLDSKGWFSFFFH